MSNALARPVDIGSVNIRLLPRPGFDLENVVIYDDPAFGAEPMLRASEVTAVLRLTSLFRGRIEIARLDLTEPSLNIVHGDNGRWNLAALVERTARNPLAPTAKAKSEPRPGFPYIEASGARVNFKSGREKKPYALLNADFALWQDSENTWGVRLKAQPLRSDLNLSDTGILRVNGTWQRAATLRETPMQFRLEWERPQLGQLTKFLTGADKGWRGAVQVEATVSGTPLKLQVSGDASVRDFRRYDITMPEAMQLTAHCDAHYTSLDHKLHEVLCESPVGDGSITLSGEMGLPGSHIYGLMLKTENLPVNSLVGFAQRVKKNLPDDLAATGRVQGEFSLHENGVADLRPRFEGRGELNGTRLSSASNKVELNPGNVSFVVRPEKPENQTTRPSSQSASSRGAMQISEDQVPRLEFDAFPMPLGKTAPALVRAWVSQVGYGISLSGDSEISHTLRVAHLFGVPAVSTSAEGGAQLDLQIAGKWADRGSEKSPGFSPSQITGMVRLHNVRAELRGLGGPVEISSADLQLLPNEVRVSKLTVNAARTSWTGTLELPRGCGTPAACAINFNLNVNEVKLGEFSHWVHPQGKPEAWYRLLTSASPAAPSFLTSLRASGKITANRLLVHDLAATHVVANVNLDHAKLAITGLRADLLGGMHRGDWQMDFNVKPPVYSGSGSLTEISLAHLAAAMNDSWISGTANGSYHLKASGSSSGEFWQSAEASIQFEMSDGMLSHIALGADASSLQVDRFQGRAHLHDGNVEVNDAELDSVDGVFQVKGNVSLKQELDLTLTPAGETNSGHATSSGYSITGTVTEPRVGVANPETQAQLKP